MNDDHVLFTYTIYRRPLDYPEAEFLVRRFRIMRGVDAQPDLILGAAATLDEARELVPMEADYNCGRDPGDQLQIVETWI